MSKKARNQRIFELDFLRGLALVMMVLDHLAYDLYCLPFWFPNANTVLVYEWGHFGYDVASSQWRLVLHYVFATLFLLLAGVGSALTRNRGRRIVQVAGGAFVITLATVIIDVFLRAGATILFGVLSVMAVGAILCWVCSLFGERWGKWIALAAGLGIIAGGFAIRWYESVHVPYFLWEDLPSVVLGTLRYGSDWFPVFPCAGIILVGYFLGKVLYREHRSLIPALRGKSDRFFCVIGRKPLWIYLLHQPVLMGLLFVIVSVAER